MYDQIIFSMPMGERIIINDTKPRGMITAISIPLDRDKGFSNIKIDFTKSI